jgi:hypothetical protein
MADISFAQIPHQKCNLWFTEYSVMSVDENLVDHIPSWGTTWGTHENFGNIIINY